MGLAAGQNARNWQLRVIPSIRSGLLKRALSPLAIGSKPGNYLVAMCANWTFSTGPVDCRDLWWTVALMERRQAGWRRLFLASNRF